MKVGFDCPTWPSSFREEDFFLSFSLYDQVYVKQFDLSIKKVKVNSMLSFFQT